MISLASLLLTVSHLLVSWVSLIVALWGMVLVTYHYEWRHHRQLVREARRAPAARTWLVVKTHRAELIRPHMCCQELILRRSLCALLRGKGGASCVKPKRFCCPLPV